MNDIGLDIMQAHAALNQRREQTERALSYLKALRLDFADRNDPDTWNEVRAAADMVADAHKMINAANTGIAELTQKFWETTDTGELLSKVYLWLYGDRLIDYSDAIRILKGLDRNAPIKNTWRVMITDNLTRLRNPETLRPWLTRYWDRSETYGGRLLIDEVIALKERKEQGKTARRSPSKKNPDRRKYKRKTAANPFDETKKPVFTGEDVRPTGSHIILGKLW